MVVDYQHMYQEWHHDTGHWIKPETWLVLVVISGYGQMREICLILVAISGYWTEGEACWTFLEISWVLVLSFSFQIWQFPLLFEGKGTSLADEH